MRGSVGTSGLVFPSLLGAKTLLPPPLTAPPFLRKSGRRMVSCLLPLRSSPQSSPNPMQSFPALEVLHLQSRPRCPSAPFPSFPSPRASGPGPQFLHPFSLSIPAPPSPTPPYLHSDPPSAPRSQDPDPSLAPTLHNSARLSPRGLRGRSTKGGAAAARLRMLLPPPPLSPPPSLLPPLPSTGPGALSQSMLVRCPGVRISATDFFPHPPTPSFVPTRLELPLLPRPPPLAPRDGHALSGGCCAGAAGLLKGPAAAIRHARLVPGPSGTRVPADCPTLGLTLIP